MPVDLYVGGAEHAVLHLLYSRFWHKVLFDRGLVSTPEPFQKLVNQGMILGETEYTGYRDAGGTLGLARKRASRPGVVAVKLDRRARSSRRARDSCWPTTRAFGSTRGPTRCRRPRQRHQPRRDRRGIRRRQPAALRDVHGTARSGQALEHEGGRGRLSLPGPGLADDRRRRGRRRAARPDGSGRRADARAGQGRGADGRGGDRRLRGAAVQHGDQPADGVRQLLHGAGGAAASRRWRRSRSCSRRWRRTSPRSSGSSWARRRRWPTSPGRRSTRRS